MEACQELPQTQNPEYGGVWSVAVMTSPLPAVLVETELCRCKPQAMDTEAKTVGSF